MMKLFVFLIHYSKCLEGSRKKSLIIIFSKEHVFNWNIVTSVILSLPSSNPFSFSLLLLCTSGSDYIWIYSVHSGETFSLGRKNFLSIFLICYVKSKLNGIIVKFLIKMSNGQKVQFYVSLEDAGEWHFFFFSMRGPHA